MYDTQELIDIAVDAIEKKNCVFLDDLLVYLPCSKQTFYDHKLDKVDAIKKGLLKNKIDTKQKLRKDWLEDGNPTCQIVLYKLLGTKDERDIINGNPDNRDKEDTNINVKFNDND